MAKFKTNTSEVIAKLQKEAFTYYQRAKLAEAKKICDQILQMSPENTIALEISGIHFLVEKQFHAAVAVYTKLIAVNPKSSNAYVNRGIALKAMGKFDPAIQSFDVAISLSQKDPKAYYNRANALVNLKKFDNAVSDYKRAIILDPNFAEAYANLGGALIEDMQYSDALHNLDKAISLNPVNENALYNRGKAFHNIGRYEEAIHNYDRAIALNSSHFEATNDKGLVLHELRNYEEALKHFDQTIVINPDYAQAYCNRGNTLHKQRRLAEALSSYNKAIELKPDFAQAYNNRGNILVEFEQLNEALASYNKAIEVKSDFAQAYSNRGDVLFELDLLHEAVASYNKALELNSEIDFLIGSKLFAEFSLCDWSNAINDRDKISQQIEVGKRVCTPFKSSVFFNSPSLLRKSAEIFAESWGIVPTGSLAITDSPNKKIHIGYFSADLREHAVSFLTAEMFELHDKERFEITAFSYYKQKSDDAMRRRLRDSFDSFIDVSGKSSEETANLSRKLGIDIAVDLNGYTKNSRPHIFGFRAAPIQVSYIGYLGTTGTAAMDYLISDQVITPKGSEIHYSEKIVRLPSYQVNDSKRPVGERIFSKSELGLPENAFVFCSFNNCHKISPEVFSSWMTILKSSGNSVLLLLAGHVTVEQNLRREAQVEGIDPGRLVFAKKLPRDEYIARFRCADLFLDTLPYNAGTTASDALWAGLPILTCLGETFSGRVCASILTSIGLPDLITRTSNEYEALAIELATKPNKLAHVRDKLKANRHVTQLFDSSRFTKNIEAAYSAMYERYTNGLPPDHIDIEDYDDRKSSYC